MITLHFQAVTIIIICWSSQRHSLHQFAKILSLKYSTSVILMNSLEHFPPETSLPLWASKGKNQLGQVQNPVAAGHWTRLALHAMKAIFLSI